MVLLLTAFRLAWPAFAYSIEDDREARRTYAFVLTYLVLLTTWVATGPRAALAVDRRLDRRARVRGVVARRRAARVRGRRLRRVHRRRDRRRPREAHAVQLGRDRGGGGRERRAEPAADPALRDDGRRDRDRRRVLDDVRRDGVVVAAHLPRPVPVAPRRDGCGCRRRARRGREARRRRARARARPSRSSTRSRSSRSASTSLPSAGRSGRGFAWPASARAPRARAPPRRRARACSRSPAPAARTASRTA